MKNKSVHLDEILAKEFKSDEFRMAFDEKLFYLQIAHLIGELRKKAGISQAEIARRAGVSQPLVARLEKGDANRTPTFDTVYKILQALGYKMSIHIQKDKKGKAA